MHSSTSSTSTIANTMHSTLASSSTSVSTVLESNHIFHPSYQTKTLSKDRYDGPDDIRI